MGRGNATKGKNDMKKVFLFSAISIFCMGAAMASDMLPAGGYYETRAENCDMDAMRAQLDRATAERRAVITVVKCAPARRPAAAHVSDEMNVVELGGACAGCVAPVERVIDRRVYVEETVQQYRPVVRYVPAGTYTRTRPAYNECNM